MSTVQDALKQTRELLRHSNPVPGAALRGQATSAAAQALLRDITSGARGPVLTAPAPARSAGSGLPDPTRGPARRWVLAGGAVAGLTAAGVLVRWPGSGGTAEADVPPVLPYALAQGEPAAPVLERIATAAEVLPAPQRRRYAYVRTDGWYLAVAVAGGTSSSVLTATQAETWTAADGRGRSRQVRGPVQVARVGSQETLDSLLGSPDSGGDGVSEQVFGEDGPALFPPTDVAALPWDDPQTWVNTVNHHDNPDIPLPVDVVAGVRTLFGEQPLTPADRARVWRLLAAQPGVTDRGPLVDRLGRTGRAVTLDADGLQRLLVVDEATGQLLEADDVRTSGAEGAFDTLPAVEQVTVFVASGWVDRDDERPTDARSTS